MKGRACVWLVVTTAALFGLDPATGSELDRRAPSPVAERIIDVRGRIARVSLFDNRVAVVAFREPNQEPEIRRVRLPPDQYALFVRGLERAFVGGEGTLESTVSSPDSLCTVYLHVGPGAPRTIAMSPVAAIDSHLGQVLGVLDAVEQVVLDAPPWFEEVSSWRPQLGDRVQLAPGMTAVVVELVADDIVVVEHELTSVREVIPPEARLQVVIDILEPSE